MLAMAIPSISPRAGSRIFLKNIVYLTDFSRCSAAALPFAFKVANAFDAKVYALYINIPYITLYITNESPAVALETLEEIANAKMEAVDAKLAGARHESLIERSENLWKALQGRLKQCEVDLVVVGSHGRTGIRKLLLGSTAEKLLRTSRVPVLTVGPSVPPFVEAETRFRRILLATDLQQASQGATNYATSLAQENEAELTLLHVIEHRPRKPRRSAKSLSVAEAMHRLQEEVPPGAGLWCRPEAVIELGQPGAEIVAVARRKRADLIVLGVRDAKQLFASTHLEMRTAHAVIANAECPVMSVPTITVKGA